MRPASPTPARARRLLCVVGRLTGEEAFGAAVVPRLDGDGRPIAPARRAEMVREADAARLSDDEALRLWWQKRELGEGIPLDRLHASGAITERQRQAGMRYARAAWRLLGLPWPKAAPVYRKLGAVPDDRAGLLTAPDPDAVEAADRQAEKDLAEAALAVRVRCGEAALRIVGAVAIYLEDRAVVRSDIESAGSPQPKQLLRALDAIADALRFPSSPPTAALLGEENHSDGLAGHA